MEDTSTRTSLEAYITNLGKYNEGALVGEFVPFPVTAEELADVFERIGIDNRRYEEWFITDYEIEGIPGLYDALGEYENIDELNYLGAKLDEMHDYERDIFRAAMELEGNSLEEAINITENLDNYMFIPDVNDHDDLGRYYVEELDAVDLDKMGNLAQYFDYDAYGRDIAMEVHGMFAQGGFIIGDGTANIYTGREDIPEEYRVCGDAQKLVSERQAKERVSAAPSLKDRIQAGREAAAEHKAPEQSPKAGRDNQEL